MAKSNLSSGYYTELYEIVCYQLSLGGRQMQTTYTYKYKLSTFEYTYLIFYMDRYVEDCYCSDLSCSTIKERVSNNCLSMLIKKYIYINKL